VSTDQKRSRRSDLMPHVSFPKQDLSVFLLLISGLTMFMAGLDANFEYDLRRIIASSTLRQLDFLIISVSVGTFGNVEDNLVCVCVCVRARASVWGEHGLRSDRRSRHGKFCDLPF
jgi:NADH:ubiquinone oxidoreductase subunit 2 (subunit N)